MLFVVRHGERGDYAGPEEKGKVQLNFDPHLTDLGQIQARKAGDKLLSLTQDYFNKTETDTKNLKYLILSSPFRRCIQTAYHLSKALPEGSIWGNKIYLNNFIGEFFGEMYMREGVLDDLQVRTDLEQIKRHVSMEIQDGFPAVGDHASEAKFPEDRDGIYNRVNDGYEKIISHYQTVVNKDKNVVLILVTHGYMVQILSDRYQGFDSKKGLEFTSLSQIAIDSNGEGKIVIAQCHEQLQAAEEEYKKMKQI